MRDRPLFVVIPALDEEACLPLVLADLQAQALPIEAVVVADNGSRDRTPEVARAAGATVVREPVRGYGAACQTALEEIERRVAAQGLDDAVVAFLDADYSDYPADLARLVDPITRGEADLVIGSRLRDPGSRAAVPFPSRLGNAFATGVIRLLYGTRFTDLGPFRAVRLSALRAITMRDRSWGWTLEMQVRACQEGLRAREVPVRYRPRRAGESKISGSLVGGARAACRILWLLSGYLLVYAVRWPPVRWRTS